MQWVAVGSLFLFLMVLCNTLDCMNTGCFTVAAHAAIFPSQRQILELKEITNPALLLYFRCSFKGHRRRTKLEVSMISAPASTGLRVSTSPGCGSLPVMQSKYLSILNSVWSQMPALKCSQWGLWLSTGKRSQLGEPEDSPLGKCPPDLVPPGKGLSGKRKQLVTFCFQETEMEKTSQFSPVSPLHLTARWLLRDLNQSVDHLTPVGAGFDCS